MGFFFDNLIYFKGLFLLLFYFIWINLYLLIKNIDNLKDGLFVLVKK